MASSSSHGLILDAIVARIQGLALTNMQAVVRRDWPTNVGLSSPCVVVAPADREEEPEEPVGINVYQYPCWAIIFDANPGQDYNPRDYRLVYRQTIREAFNNQPLFGTGLMGPGSPTGLCATICKARFGSIADLNEILDHSLWMSVLTITARTHEPYTLITS